MCWLRIWCGPVPGRWRNLGSEGRKILPHYKLYHRAGIASNKLVVYYLVHYDEGNLLFPFNPVRIPFGSIRQVADFSCVVDGSAQVQYLVLLTTFSF